MVDGGRSMVSQSLQQARASESSSPLTSAGCADSPTSIFPRQKRYACLGPGSELSSLQVGVDTFAGIHAGH